MVVETSPVDLVAVIERACCFDQRTLALTSPQSGRLAFPVPVIADQHLKAFVREANLGRDGRTEESEVVNGGSEHCCFVRVLDCRHHGPELVAAVDNVCSIIAVSQECQRCFYLRSFSLAVWPSAFCFFFLPGRPPGADSDPMTQLSRALRQDILRLNFPLAADREDAGRFNF